MILSLENISKIYNGNTVLDNISLTIEDNDRIGLVGENGCGKSTLLRIITGNEEYESQPEPHIPTLAVTRDKTIGYLAQNTGLDRSSTVIEEMRSVFAHLYKLHDELRSLEKEISAAQGAELEKKTALYTAKTAEFEAKDGYDTEIKINKVLNGLGFGESYKERIISTLSGGEKTRLALARLLLEEPSLLILDEPTNHLDFDTIAWLEDYLKGYKGALLLVSHDRYFLDRLCTSICDIERGRLRRWKGDYTKYTELREADNERRMKEYEAQQEEIARLRDFVAKNLVRASTSALAKSRRKVLEDIEANLIEKPVIYSKTSNIAFEYDVEPPLDVLSVKNADLYAGTKPLARDINFEVRRGDRIGVVGANGTGKSTLLKMLQKMIGAGDNGRIIWNKNVKIAYFDQENTQLHPELSLIDEIHTRYRTMTDLDVRSLLGRVRLTGENVFKQTGVVSGGERAKLCFALMMLERGNVLILDEPTNHLDIQTRESLEKALESYTGTLIIVSHDRYLLDRISDRILEVTPEKVNIYDCGFSQYLEQRTSAAAEQKPAKSEAKATESAQTYAKGKAQRSENAKRRARIRELEKTINENETRMRELEADMADPATASDHVLLQEKCAEYEELKAVTEQLSDEWLELCEVDVS